MLRCTYCHMDINPQFYLLTHEDMEFERCPKCDIGYLVGGNFAATVSGSESINKKLSRIRKMRAQLDRMTKILKDDDASLESEGASKYNCEFYQPDPLEVVKELSPWPSTRSPWNLQLSADDIDSQRFTTCTIDADAAKHIVDDLEPEEITTEVINKMSEIFIDTFKERLLSDQEEIS